MSKKAKSRLPVRPGDCIDVSIHGMGHRGEGVGRFEGLAVFIPEAVPGDRVRARVTKVKKGFARAELEQISEPSADREDARCPHFGKCGGCQLQHITYSSQLEIKRQHVIDAITRIGKLTDVTVHSTIGMNEPWDYRNNAQFPVGQRMGEVVAGFFAPGSHEIVNIESCHILHPVGNRVLREMKALAVQFNLPIYDERTHSGVLRYIITRIGRVTGEAIAVLVTRTSEFPYGREIAEALMERIPELVGVVQNINTNRTHVVPGNESKTLAGANHLTDYIGPFVFKISPESFFQVNPIQTEVLYRKVLEYAALSGDETVFDLYCGIGTISLFLAQKARRVVGIEWVTTAVDNAVDNAKLNGVSNVRFVAGDAAIEMPRLAAGGTRADVIVVDPPRAGCQQSVLDAVARMGPSRVVYVSCNPASLARDLGHMKTLGFNTLEVQPVDMFPHTAHIECCALLVR